VTAYYEMIGEMDQIADALKSPFPWFGGKSAVAEMVWERFGKPQNYVEPFFGSGAVLLGRPHSPGIETVNDKDCMIANFWRALQHDPDAVAHYADWPVNEADQHARHLWLSSQEEFREQIKVDPDYYDSKIAGWWVWGQSIWIGSGWCAKQLPHLGNAGKGVNRQLPHLGDAGKGVNRQRPHLGNAGMGLHRKLPHLGNAGKGVNRQLPHLGNAGMDAECLSYRTSGTPRQIPHLNTGGAGVNRVSIGTRPELYEYMHALADRLRKVRVCCGDWSRVCGPSPTVKLGTTAVFLDPPYADEAERTEDLYSSDDLAIAHEVRKWAIEWGDDRRMRIALCGYEGEHQMPDSWDCVPWKARGGYGSQGDNAARENSKKERIWFSPYCLSRKQEMFAFAK